MYVSFADPFSGLTLLVDDKKSIQLVKIFGDFVEPILTWSELWKNSPLKQKLKVVIVAVYIYKIAADKQFASLNLLTENF